jgi:hypothetical protein
MKTESEILSESAGPGTTWVYVYTPELAPDGPADANLDEKAE